MRAKARVVDSDFRCAGWTHDDAVWARAILVHFWIRGRRQDEYPSAYVLRRSLIIGAWDSSDGWEEAYQDKALLAATDDIAAIEEAAKLFDGLVQDAPRLIGAWCPNEEPGGNG